MIGRIVDISIRLWSFFQSHFALRYIMHPINICIKINWKTCLSTHIHQRLFVYKLFPNNNTLMHGKLIIRQNQGTNEISQKRCVQSKKYQFFVITNAHWIRMIALWIAPGAILCHSGLCLATFIWQPFRSDRDNRSFSCRAELGQRSAAGAQLS